jgi:hypothetical protein
METDSPALFEDWTAAWSDLVAFEIIELENREGLPGVSLRNP